MEIFKAPSVTADREEDHLKGTSNYQQWKRYMKTFYGIYLNPLIKPDADETAPKEGDQGYDRWQALQAWGCAQIGTSLALKEDNPIPEDSRRQQRPSDLDIACEGLRPRVRLVASRRDTQGPQTVHS